MKSSKHSKHLFYPKGHSTTSFLLMMVAFFLLAIMVLFLVMGFLDPISAKEYESKIYWRSMSDSIRLMDWDLKVNEYTDGTTVDLDLDITRASPDNIVIKEVHISPGAFDYVWVNDNLFAYDNMSLKLFDDNTKSITVQQFGDSQSSFVPLNSYELNISFVLDSGFTDVTITGPAIVGKVSETNAHDYDNPNPPSCNSSGGACSVDSDCCGYYFCEGGICSSTLPPDACAEHSYGCYADSACCSGRCNNNKCAVNPCVTQSNLCTINEDCCEYMNCVAGACQYYCTISGSACSADGECCSGYCNETSGQCAENPCTSGQYPCGDDPANCCSDSECRTGFVCCEDAKWNGTECCPDIRWTGTECCPDNRWSGADCCDVGEYLSGEDYGDALDGDLTVSTNQVLSPASSRVTSMGTDYVVLLSSSGFSAGDDAFLINLKGYSTAYSNVGAFEMFEIDSINSNVVYFTRDITKTFGQSSNSDLTGQIVVLQKILQYNDLTINNGGEISSDGFDGSTGGVLIIKVNDTLTINSGGNINMTAKGYSGGTTAGQGGETYLGRAGAGKTSSTGCPSGTFQGGAGGATTCCVSSTGTTGGGGGGGSAYSGEYGPGGGAGHSTVGIGGYTYEEDGYCSNFTTAQNGSGSTGGAGGIICQ